jgi:hypothetical protein
VRKRIIIGLLAVVVIGVGGFVVVRPNPDSIEYHIRAYREADRKLTAPETFLDKIRDVWRKLRTKRMGRFARLRNEMNEHKAELIRLGYLEERTFSMTNRTFLDVATAVQKAVWKRGTNIEFFGTATTNTNTLRVITRKGMMPSWEDVLSEMAPRKGD